MEAHLPAGMREVGALVLALRRELPGGSGLSLLGAISLLTWELEPMRRTRRGRRTKATSKHISISAWDSEGETVRRHEDRRAV